MESASVFAEGTQNEMIAGYHTSPQDDVIAAMNRKTFIEALDALLAGKTDHFWSTFDQNVVFHEASCLPYGGVHEGLDATKRAFERMGGYYSSMRTELEGVLASRDIVILYQTITFRVRGNGNTGSLPVAELFRFRDGKVIEWRALYFDSDMVAGAIAGDR